MNNKQIFLIIGTILIIFGLLRPDLSSIGISNRPAAIDVLELKEPSDESIKKQAIDVVNIFRTTDGSKQDAKKLRDLYIDISKLVSLDNDDEVIKSTEEIRQANSLAGLMLRLDIKGKYPNLSKEAKEVIVAAIGDDQILLSSELRAKAVEGFNALAWACNEGTK